MVAGGTVGGLVTSRPIDCEPCLLGKEEIPLAECLGLVCVTFTWESGVQNPPGPSESCHTGNGVSYSL